MPPHKQPPRLFSLSMSAAVKLVHTSLLNIATTPEALRPAAIDSVQNVLQDEVLPFMWDSLVEEVESRKKQLKNRINETDYYSIVDSLFVHENMRKFIVNVDPINADIFSSKLKYLVDLDLSSLTNSEPQSSALALVGSVCSKLECIRMAGISVPGCYQALGGCSELRSITYGWIKDRVYQLGQFATSSDNVAAKLALELFPKLEHYSLSKMGQVLLTLESNKPLQLRYIKEDQYTVDNIKRIISLCPNLQRLDTNSFPHYSDCSQILEILSESSLEIRDLTTTVTHFDDSIEHFLENKGIHLRKLTLNSPPIPLYTAQVIAKHCSNLTHLTLQTPSRLQTPSSNSSYVDDGRFKQQRSTLANLQKLTFNSAIPFMLDTKLFTTLLPKTTNLSSLEIQAREVNINEFLVKLMNSVVFDRLNDLNLLASESGMLTERVLRDIYTKIPSLKHLVVGGESDQQFKQYLEEIRRQVNDNNLDFDVNCFRL